jgi:flavin reductase (DIM6/NTAB) family NADH-FMN oxidoreductase RutF
MQEFHEIEPTAIVGNAFQLIAEDWMLITAGPPDAFNTMTANWGGFGELWHHKVVFVFVRPQRYTYEFMERWEPFTLSFFAEQYRDALTFCGTNSGRDVDKVAATGLTPVAGEAGGVYFAEAHLVVECRKLYAQDLQKDCFTRPEIDTEIYPAEDYHRCYVGQVVRCLTRRAP